MAGNQSVVSICSNALIMLGAEPISDLSGADAGTVAASNLFENAYQNVLESYDWNFARKKVQLARKQAAPINTYDYAFSLPTDLLRLINADSSDYDIIGNELQSSSQSVYIEYVANTDINKAPYYFANALELMMASKLAIPVTGDIDKASLYMGLYERAIRKARHLDARQTPTKDIVSKPFIDARFN